MGQGLRIPIGVNRGGGANLEPDPQHLTTILRLALSEGNDDNPFQQLGISDTLIFALNDSSNRGLARNAVERILNKFSERLRLDQTVPVDVIQTGDGEVELSFRYVNLDTNKVSDFIITFTT